MQPFLTSVWASFFIEFVLRGTGQRDIGLDQLPGALIFVIGGRFEHFGIFGDTSAADVLQFLDIRQFFGIDAVLVDDGTVGVGHGKDFTAELDGFFDGELGHVAGTGNQDLASFERGTAGGQHFGGEVNVAVTGGFRTDQAAAPVQAFAGQHAVKTVV